ncbi:MAG: HAMP domain-containing histidine kinase [Candidatus Dormibacteraeota bacterium]|nr:HAMP domain-containing histidine kinase [Candidatus Dormibacteraeota bacterium]
MSEQLPRWDRRSRERWRRAPPWWPQGQEWPPRGADQWREQWRRGGQRAVRWGCAIALAIAVIILSALAGVVWLILSALGVIGSAPLARIPSGIAVLLGVIAVIIAVQVLRRLGEPATSLVAAAQRIEAGDYSARVPVRGPRQLRSLARAFNEMSSRLEAEEARRQTVIADVAHELRTPLTVIRGQTEAIIDGIYTYSPERLTPILAATDTLEALIEDLRTLAQAETGVLRLHREPTDLGLLVNGTLDAFRGTAAEQGVTLTASIADPSPVVDGDPVRLGSVLRNLVTNALRHTPRGGSIVAAVEGSADGAVQLTVTDSGEGIAPELLSRVFDRFVKDRSSPGSGLGLAIVRDIVEAHGGSVVARNNPAGGATLEVTLPAAVADAG